MDKFLAGEDPMSPQKWFAKFSQRETAFLIEPYRREEAAEEKFYIKQGNDRYVHAYTK